MLAKTDSSIYLFLRFFLVTLFLFGVVGSVYGEGKIVYEVGSKDITTSSDKNVVYLISKNSKGSIQVTEYSKSDEEYISLENNDEDNILLKTSNKVQAIFYANLGATTTDEYNRLENDYKSGNWNDFSDKQIRSFSENNVKLDNPSKIYTDYETLKKEVEALSKEESKEKDYEKKKEELEKRQDLLKEIIINNPELIYELSDSQVKEMTASSCDSTWYNPFSWCFVEESLDKSELQNQLILKNINNIESQSIGENSICPDSMSISDCKKEVDLECSTGSSDCEELKNEILRIEQEAYFENAKYSVNKATGNDLCKESTSFSDCETKIKNSKAECGDDTECRQNHDLALEGLDTYYKKQPVQTNLAYDIISAIANPDQNAIKAAKLFGFEADYSNVPKFLKESFPSQICLNKIDGYLDKQIEYSGGTTRFQCSNADVLDARTDMPPEDINTNCLEVYAHLAAQRTRIVADGTTAITYSAILQAPENQKIRYLLGITYIQNGNLVKAQLDPENHEGIQNLSAGSLARIYENIDFEVNLSKGPINENSFQIILDARDESMNSYIFIKRPILFINTSDGTSYYEFKGEMYTGNSAGNTQAQQQSEQQQSATPQDFMEYWN